jgi:restriction endonuclease Mrr
MQPFVGALHGAQTTRGVFLTTGSFSSGARQFADQVAMRLVLIDGTELTRLMVPRGVGGARWGAIHTFNTPLALVACGRGTAYHHRPSPAN